MNWLLWKKKPFNFIFGTYARSNALAQRQKEGTMNSL